MKEDLEILKGYVEGLGLNLKETLQESDRTALYNDLYDSGEFGLANYIKSLGSVTELEDLIVNTIYG